MLLKKSVVLLSAAAAAGAGLVMASPPASADPAVAGTYNAVTQTRVLDTRIGTGAPKQTVASGQTLTTKVTPSSLATNPSAVALTVTVVSPAAPGYLIAFAGGTSRPQTSNINFVPGSNTPNSVIVRVSATGTASFYNGSAGVISLVVDLYGYWTGGTATPPSDGSLVPVAPARAFDSRSTGNKAIPARSSASVPIAGRAGVPTTGVSAVVANITAVAPARSGYLTVDAVASDGTPGTSTVNFADGETRANMALVPVNPDGTISIRNESPTTNNVIVDITGYFTDGTPSGDGSYVSSNPYRAAGSSDDAPVAARATYKVQLFPENSDPVFKAVAVNITAASPTANGWLMPYSGSGTAPISSASNFKVGQAPRATTVVVPVNADGSIAITNASNGSVRIVVDVEGFVLNGDVQAMTEKQAQQRITSSLERARAYSANRVSK